MANANLVLFFVTVIIFAVGYFVGRASIPKIYGVSEGFVPVNQSEKVSLTGDEPSANEYKENFGDNAEGFTSDSGECIPDPSRYVLRSTIPPCSPQINMDRYMLKSECTAGTIDMSKYVLKSSVPVCPPCVCAGQKPAKCGECPPCPRPKPLICPEVRPCNIKMPEIDVKPCPSQKLSCKSVDIPESAVKPSLASMSAFGF